MKKLLKKYGFTLVELIVVVVILAVLAALAFMMVSKWIGASKDSNRLSTIATIRRGIDMNYIEKGSYPFPDADNEEGKVITGTVNGKTVLYKGTIGENVIKNLGNTLTKVPLDPIGKRYAYGITASGKEYEIGTVLENETKLGILDKAYALNYKAKLEGTYGGMIVFSTGGKQYIANIPSLVFTVSGSVANSMNMISNNIYYAINSGNNLPYIVTTKSDAQKDNMNAVIKLKTNSTTATVQSVEIPTATDLSTIFNGDVLTSFGGNLGTIQNEIKKQSGQTTITSAPGTIQSCTCSQSNATICEQIFDGNTWGTCSVKTCNSGYTVSGNSCEESACGGTPSGSTNNFYDVSSVPYVDNNCPAHMKTFTCDKGEWKDGLNPADTATYQYLACSRGTPTNCTATTYNGYIIPDTTHALSGSATKDVIENNGTFRYTQNFECNNGTFNYTLETGPEYLSCNTNYNRNGTSCELLNYFAGAGTSLDPYRLSTELATATTVTATSCNYYNLNATKLNNGTTRGTGTCGGGKTCLTDGIYLIDADGSGGANAFQVYCDMTNDAGGWTVMGNWDTRSTDSTNFIAENSFGTIGLNSSNWKLSNTQISTLWNNTSGCNRRIRGLINSVYTSYYSNQTISTNWPTNFFQLNTYTDSNCTTIHSNVNTCSAAIAVGFGACSYNSSRMYWGLKDGRAPELSNSSYNVSSGKIQLQVK